MHDTSTVIVDVSEHNSRNLVQGNRAFCQKTNDFGIHWRSLSHLDVPVAVNAGLGNRA